MLISVSHQATRCGVGASLRPGFVNSVVEEGFDRPPGGVERWRLVDLDRETGAGQARGATANTGSGAGAERGKDHGGRCRRQRGTETEKGREAGHRVEAPVEAEDVLVEVVIEVIGTDPVVSPAQPGLPDSRSRDGRRARHRARRRTASSPPGMPAGACRQTTGSGSLASRRSRSWRPARCLALTGTASWACSRCAIMAGVPPPMAADRMCVGPVGGPGGTRRTSVSSPLVDHGEDDADPICHGETREDDLVRTLLVELVPRPVWLAGPGDVHPARAVTTPARGTAASPQRRPGGVP